MNRQTSLRIAGDQLAGLDWHAKRRGVTRSDLIREALAAWLIEHPAGKQPPSARAPGPEVRHVPSCARCGRAVAGPLAMDAARLDPVEISRVTRWACGLCATADESRTELACKLIESGEALADERGRLWTKPSALNPITSAGHQLQLPPGFQK